MNKFDVYLVRGSNGSHYLMNTQPIETKCDFLDTHHIKGILKDFDSMNNDLNMKDGDSILVAKKPPKFTQTHYSVPRMFRDELKAYVENHKEPSEFLFAALSNDFVSVTLGSQKYHKQELIDLSMWLYGELDADLWGSPQKVEAHIKKGESE